jgi:hypothetical protein
MMPEKQTEETTTGFKVVWCVMVFIALAVVFMDIFFWRAV